LVLTVIWQLDSLVEEYDMLARWRGKSSRSGGPPSADEPVTYFGRRQVAMYGELERGEMVARLWAVRRGGVNRGEYRQEVTEFLPPYFPRRARAPAISPSHHRGAVWLQRTRNEATSLETVKLSVPPYTAFQVFKLPCDAKILFPVGNQTHDFLLPHAKNVLLASKHAQRLSQNNPRLAAVRITHLDSKKVFGQDWVVRDELKCIV
jgi:hypothetical protein